MKTYCWKQSKFNQTRC